MKAIKKHTKYNQFINQIELNMQSDPLELPLKHYFTDGMYVREIFIPKGVCLTSRVHKTCHPFVLSMGTIDILTETEIMRYVAPFTGINQIGTRRMGWALEDCIFSTFHSNPDDCRDLDVIEQRLFEYYPNPLLTNGKKKKEIKK